MDEAADAEAGGVSCVVQDWLTRTQQRVLACASALRDLVKRSTQPTVETVESFTTPELRCDGVHGT